MKKLFYLSFITLFYSSFLNAQTWQSKSNFSGSARIACEMVDLNNKGYLLFGDNRGSNTYYNDIWEYNPSSDSWTLMPTSSISARSFTVVLSNDSNLLIGMGWNGSATFKDFYSYTPNSNTWDTLTNYPGNGGRALFNAIHNGKVYIGGGNIGTSTPYSQDFWEYDINTDSWTNKGNLPFGRRIGGVNETIDSIIYMGMGHDGANDFKDLWAYNTNTSTWSQKTDFPGTGRLGMTSFVLDGKLVVGGGHRFGSNGQGLKNDYYEYDPSTDTWTTFSNSFTNSGRTFSGSFVINNQAYIYGGSINYPNAMNDVWAIQGNTVNVRELDAKSHIDFSIYPNPTRGETNFASTTNEINGILTIYNSSGQTITEKKLNQEVSSINLNLNGIENGLYFYRFVTSTSEIATGTITKID